MSTITKEQAIQIILQLEALVNNSSKTKLTQNEYQDLRFNLDGLKKLIEGIETPKMVPPRGALLIGQAQLSMMMNCFRRDAENGNKSREEMLEMLNEDLEKWDKLYPS